jgi:hypothetical protein
MWPHIPVWGRRCRRRLGDLTGLVHLPRCNVGLSPAGSVISLSNRLGAGAAWAPAPASRLHRHSPAMELSRFCRI